jgi:hypothetical protein
MSNHEAEISRLIERWVAAVQANEGTSASSQNW